MHIIVWHVGFRQQHIHVTRHTPGHRVNGVAYFYALLFQLVSHLTQSMLGLRNRHAIARNNDNRRSVFHDERRIFRRAAFHRAGFHRASAASYHIVATKAAEDNREERTVHRFTHNVRQNRARRADQRTGDDERQIAQSETNAGRRPTRIRVQHRHNHGHICATDGNDDQEANDK